MTFINLHVHDAQGSLLDSIATVEQIANYAKENDQPAIALTNHNGMSSFVSFYKACAKNNVKPILGWEAYEVDNPLEKSDTKEYQQLRYHLVLLARNQTGLKNLFKIVTQGCTDFFYKKPRISIPWIKENNLGEGIICLSACQAGRLSRLLVANQQEEAEDFVRNLQYVFDYFVCELQSHATESQMLANQKIYEFVKKHDLPYVITTDAHMVREDQAETHSIFVQISEDREVGESYSGCFLQNEQDVYRILGNQFESEVIAHGIDETLHVASMIEPIDIGLNHGSVMPKINIQEGFTSNEDYLRHLVFKDFDVKFGHLSETEQQIRRERLETELPVLIASNFTDYFIMLYMLVQEANKRNIPRGYSRGSGANCLCLYMLGVTQIDSVRWDLDFSRFANLGRKSLADFDWDISKLRRKEFVEISEELFGKENVAPIATFNTLSTKVAVRDIGRVLNDKGIYGLPYTVRDEVSKMIPTIKIINESGEEEEKEVKLKEALFQNDKLKNIADQYPLWFKYVIELEGLPKSMGRHAAGTLITPNPVVEYCPLCHDKDDNLMVQLEMHSAMDDLGLVKMDYLGLETVDIVNNTLKLAGLTWQDVDINKINLDDKRVYNEVFKSGNTIGIFQMESAEAKSMCVEAEVDNIEDVVVINAANRPGTKESFPEYCFNKRNPDKVELLHDDLRSIFGKTHFVLLYQEQALQMFRYAGFPEEQVDNARRSIGKKQKDVMEKLHDQFCDGLRKKNWSKEQIETMWHLLLKQSEYSFNRGHSTAYSLMSYLTAYLKTYYPVEFMASCLTAKSDNLPKLSLFMNECKRLGIQILPPNINHSDKEFTPHRNEKSILFGLLGIKGIGGKLIDQILQERKNGDFKNFKDFETRIRPSVSQVVGLIKAGAIPCKDKKKYLLQYANTLVETKPYTPVSTLPSAKVLKEKWNLDCTKDDKENRLLKYNSLREQEFVRQQENKRKKFIQEFDEKYLQDEELWEYGTLSVFLTNNPFEETQHLLTPIDDVVENGKCVCVGVISDITKRTDRHDKQFAYLKIFSTFDILDLICWHSQYKEYQNIIKKGAKVAAMCKKTDDNRLIVEKLKTYDQWLMDIREKRKK
jgi:DNA polymerase-3 subunit alpha